MRTSRIYTRQTLDTGATLTLDEETSHYLLRVLRTETAALAALAAVQALWGDL